MRTSRADRSLPAHPRARIDRDGVHSCAVLFVIRLCVLGYRSEGRNPSDTVFEYLNVIRRAFVYDRVHVMDEYENNRSQKSTWAG